jgi:histidyl-tRNA synthetase
VSDRRLLRGLLLLAGVAEDRLRVVYPVIDKLEREPREVLAERLRRAGLDDVLIARVFAVLEDRAWEVLRAEYGDVPELREEFARLASYFEYLDALGVGAWVRFDLSIVRGLAYYTGIVFELFDARGAFRAIAGGGRYDSLLGALGGGDLPALGFGMGDVVLGELLRDRGLLSVGEFPLDYWVVGGEGVALATVMQIAAALRRRGMRVEYALRPQKPAKQVKAAVSAGAAKVMLIHDPRVATVRRLRDGAERSVDPGVLDDGSSPVQPSTVAPARDPFPLPSDGDVGER